MTRRAYLLLWPALAGFAGRGRLFEQRAFDAINGVRVQHHLPPLRWSAQIAAVARQHSVRMLEHHFFSHEDPRFGGPGNRLSMAGINWRACAENIFEDYGERDPVRAAVTSWMRSEGHRRNLLSPLYSASGIGVAIGPRGEVLITQLFVGY